MIIYKITCLVNGKVYIGQTSESIEKRFKRHIGYQKNEHDTKFYRAIRKYGADNFKIEQIDTASTQEELDAKEMYWIAYYDAIQSGYNTKASSGKCGGDTLSHHPQRDIICEKVRHSKIGDKNPMRKCGGLKGERNGMYGKHGKNHVLSRKCMAISIEDNDIIYFDSLRELQLYFQVPSLSMVALRCQGKTKSPHKGYYFKYNDDHEEGVTTIENIAG